MKFNPEKTAMRRNKLSRPARYLVDKGIINGSTDVLDYGCGFGDDLEFLKNIAYTVDGYDPHPKFARQNKPTDLYDVVMLNYVINTIADEGERIATITRAWKLVKVGGTLLVATRSKNVVENQAKLGTWLGYKDGFITSTKKGTFQKGFTFRDLVPLLINCKWMTFKVGENNKKYTSVVVTKGSANKGLTYAQGPGFYVLK